VYEEFSEGINSVAAPIFDEDSKVIAAVHAHGPAYRFPADRSDSADHISGLVVAAAREIERTLRR
jgi:DNA-binding IclR family transcriptional regulator